MNLRAWYRAAKAKVFAEYGFGLFDIVLLKQERSESMARWLHPAPGFVVWQRVFAGDREAELFESQVEVSFAVFDLALQHAFGDLVLFPTRHVVKASRFRDVFAGFMKQRFVYFGIFHVAGGRVGHAFGVVTNGCEIAVDATVCKRDVRDSIQNGL